MTLENILSDLNNINDDLIIFQKDELSIESETVLFEHDDDSTLRIKDNVKYVYFLEVDLAKEFINDWVNSLKIKPSSKDIALRLLQYAIYDA